MRVYTAVFLACVFHRCFIFPLDTPISVLRCAKYKFISKPETSRETTSEELDGICARYHIFHCVRSNLSNEEDVEEGKYNLLYFSFAVKMRILRKSPALRRIVCRNSLIQFSRFHLFFSEILFPSSSALFALVFLSLSLFLSLRLHLPSATIPPAAISDNLGE